MPRNPGCWANALDDCNGPLTEEHIVSVAVWAAEPGRPNNRRGRLNRVLRVAGGHHLPPGDVRVRDLTALILCEHHNNTSSPVDEAGGQFARAIDEWDRLYTERIQQRDRRWPQRTLRVNGRLLERWFLKTAINMMFGGDRPIGAHDAQVGWPTPALAEMVFGHRRVREPAGLFMLVRRGQDFRFAERIETIFFSANEGTHYSGCLMAFRSMVFGVNFENTPLPDGFFDAFESLTDAALLQPFNEMNSPVNLALRLDW